MRLLNTNISDDKTCSEQKWIKIFEKTNALSHVEITIKCDRYIYDVSMESIELSCIVLTLYHLAVPEL